MSCDRWRESISARLDGEVSPIDEALVDEHLRRCESCRAYAGNGDVLRRAARIGVAPAMVDLAPAVVRRARTADRASVWGGLRLGLAVTAVPIIVLSAPALLLGDEAGADRHEARHLGSFAVAYAIGLLVVALRPAKARSMLPLTFALSGALVTTAIVDVASGRTPALAEVGHLPEVASMVFMWLLAAGPRRWWGPGRSGSAPAGAARLRLLDAADEPLSGAG
jgi:predicted anti-sigma-YlaC factor YlaD